MRNPQKISQVTEATSPPPPRPLSLSWFGFYLEAAAVGTRFRRGSELPLIITFQLTRVIHGEGTEGAGN